MGTPKLAEPLSRARQFEKSDALSGRAMVPRPGRTSLVQRRFSFSYLRSDGGVVQSEQVAPAIPLFEAAFSALAHGVLLATPNGPCAVQDLWPGMEVITPEGPEPILWIGSMTLVPNNNISPPARLYRVMPDAFGVGRPASNLLLGPGARLMTRPAALRDTLTQEPMLTPCRDLVDGAHVIELSPPRPITVYHIALVRHAILRADGLETESYHPGAGFERGMNPDLLALFLSLFPHIDRPAAFGPLACRQLPLVGI